jgi:hypothetical protein
MNPEPVDGEDAAQVQSRAAPGNEIEKPHIKPPNHKLVPPRQIIMHSSGRIVT